MPRASRAARILARIPAGEGGRGAVGLGGKSCLGGGADLCVALALGFGKLAIDMLRFVSHRNSPAIRVTAILGQRFQRDDKWELPSEVFPQLVVCGQKLAALSFSQGDVKAVVDSAPHGRGD